MIFGGRAEVSVPLAELTALLLEVGSDPAIRPAVIPYDVSDNGSVCTATGWTPTQAVEAILGEMLEWLARYRAEGEPVRG